MKALALLPTLALAATLGACSWGIKLDNAGTKVRTAWDGNVAGCRELGKVTVSVLDHVGPVDRNNLKVRDELQTMARNQAAEMGADTIKPLGEPRDGEQGWGAYACGPATTTSPSSSRPAAPGKAVETYPIKGD